MNCSIRTSINSITCSVRRRLRASKVPALSAVCCSVKVLLNWEVRMPDSNPSSSTTRLASSANLCCKACQNTDSTVWCGSATTWQQRLSVTDSGLGSVHAWQQCLQLHHPIGLQCLLMLQLRVCKLPISRAQGPNYWVTLLKQ